MWIGVIESNTVIKVGGGLDRMIESVLSIKLFWL